jgi:hypothetical protein
MTILSQDHSADVFEEVMRDDHNQLILEEAAVVLGDDPGYRRQDRPLSLDTRSSIYLCDEAASLDVQQDVLDCARDNTTYDEIGYSSSGLARVANGESSGFGAIQEEHRQFYYLARAGTVGLTLLLKVDYMGGLMKASDVATLTSQSNEYSQALMELKSAKLLTNHEEDIALTPAAHKFLQGLERISKK